MRTIMRMTSLVALLALLGAPLGAQERPGNLQAIATGPTTVTLSWTAAANANGYIVQRWIGTNAMERLTPVKIPGTAYTDAAAPAASALRYRIRAVYPNNGPATFSDIVSVTTPSAPATTASSSPPPASPPPGQPTTEPATSGSPAQAAVRAGPVPLKTYSAPPVAGRAGATLSAAASAASPTPPALPADPSGFTAVLQGNKVTLSWQGVPGVAWYLLGGPGMGAYGQQVQGTSYTFDAPGPGQYEWTVASLAGEGLGPLNNGANWPRKQLTIAPAMVHSARYRVTMIGFAVNEQTLDDSWNWDGKGDEVYLAAYVGLKDRKSNAMGPRGHVRSVIYGDVNNQSGRIVAGSLSDLGGLKTGDSYPDNGGGAIPLAGPESDKIPLLVWEGPLTDAADVLVIAPTVWESDQHQETFIRWWQRLDQVIPDIFNDKDVAADVGAADLHPVVARELDLSIAGSGADRPLGMRPAGYNLWMRQQVVVLTREKIESALASPYKVGGFAAGVIPVAFTDWTDEGLGLRGSYTAYLRVERLP